MVYGYERWLRAEEDYERQQDAQAIQDELDEDEDA